MAKIPTPNDRIFPHAVTFCETVSIRVSPRKVYHFLLHEMERVYPELADGHECFRPLDAESLREGAVIDCRERAGNQEVHHRYVVEKLVQNKHIYYVSKPTQTFIHLKNRVIEGRANTHVYYDLEADGEVWTHLRMTIIIQMESAFRKWLGLLFGKMRSIWGQHQQEELKKLVQIIERESPDT